MQLHHDVTSAAQFRFYSVEHPFRMFHADKHLECRQIKGLAVSSTTSMIVNNYDETVMKIFRDKTAIASREECSPNNTN